MNNITLYSAVKAVRPLIDVAVLGRVHPPGSANEEIFRLEISLAAGGRKLVSALVLSRVDRLQTVRTLKQTLKLFYEDQMMLVAPYISSSIAKECMSIGLEFMDAAGNIFVRVDGSLIFISGMGRPQLSAEDRMHTAPYSPWSTASGLRTIFALLVRPDLISAPQREIAACAGVALGSVGKVVKSLIRQRFATSDESGNLRLVGVDELVDRWVVHFASTLRPRLKSRFYKTMDEPPSKMALEGLNAGWGGEYAAGIVDGYIKPITLTIYSGETESRLIRALRMIPSDSGNVEVLEKFWGDELTLTCNFDVQIVPRLLIYADLMKTGNSRCAEAAKLLRERGIHG